MILSAEEVKQLYRRTAPFYDAAVWMYRLTGVTAHREVAVQALRLNQGDTVVDLGCGTGLNLALLREAVGPSGHVIGVDLTDAMLKRARRLVDRSGWQNVNLVEADMRDCPLPAEVKAVLSTFALEMVPEHDELIRSVAHSLPSGGRIALLGLKHPKRWPRWAIQLGIWINRPFGVTSEYAAIRPWESIRRHLREVMYREFYAGAAYLSVGEAPQI